MIENCRLGSYNWDGKATFIPEALPSIISIKHRYSFMFKTHVWRNHCLFNMLRGLKTIPCLHTVSSMSKSSSHINKKSTGNQLIKLRNQL